MSVDATSGGSAGTGGMNAVQAATGGAGSTGGAGGTSANPDCTTWRSFPNCGAPCSVTLEQYCTAASVRPCVLGVADICTRYAFGSTWTRGCGYVRVEDWGDVGDRWINVWNEASGELVYHWFSGLYSSGCVPELSVGAEPACSNWVSACADGGA